MFRGAKLSHGRNEGRDFKMVGALPGNTLMGHKRVVSYNIGSFIEDNIIGKAGASFIGHEFHHSEIVIFPMILILPLSLNAAWE